MRWITPLLFALLAGCGPPPYEARRSNEVMLNLAAIGSQTGYEEGCKQDDDLKDCVPLLPPERISGTWGYGFQVSSFKPDGAIEMLWLEPNRELQRLADADNGINCYRTYRLDFMGRRSELGEYGDMGQFDAVVVVDRLISMKETWSGPMPAACRRRSNERENPRAP